MNERFEHFIYESGLIAQGCWDKFDEYDIESLERFAQFIVRECEDIADEYDDAGSTIASRIKEHFGVEE